MVNSTDTTKTKERIKRYQVQHKTTIASLESEFKEYIEMLDSTAEEVCITFSKMVLTQTNSKVKRILVSVDHNDYNKNTSFT